MYIKIVCKDRLEDFSFGTTSTWAARAEEKNFNENFRLFEVVFFYLFFFATALPLFPWNIFYRQKFPNIHTTLFNIIIVCYWYA